MTKNGRYKGIISFDGMFSIIPILLLVVFVLNAMSYLMYDSIEKVTAQEKFNMLVMIADYAVKNPDGAAYVDGDRVYPNLIDPSRIPGLESDIASDLHMPGLEIMLESGSTPPSTEKTCIYRLVVNKDDGEIDRLFVCG